MSALASILQRTWRKWRDDGAVRQGAALAFYTLFSLVPLGVVVHRLGESVLGASAVDALLHDQLGTVLPDALVPTTAALLRGEASYSAPVLAACFAAYAGMRGLLQLQATLNDLWGVKAVRGPGPIEMVRRKLWAFASAGATAALLLIALVADRAVEVAAERRLPVPASAWLADGLTNLALLTALLAVVWRLLADVRISWTNVAIGASCTALALVCGQELIAAYLAHSGRAEAFGVAGPVIAVLLYAYYAAQVLLAGVCLTWVVAETRGDPITPNARAARVVKVRVDDERIPASEAG